MNTMESNALQFVELPLHLKIKVMSRTGIHEDELRDGTYYFTEDGDSLLRFSELDNRARNRARRDYQKGWEESHCEPEPETFGDDIVSGDDAFLFTTTGKFFCEEP